MRWLAVATMRRGVLAMPEALDDAENASAELSYRQACERNIPGYRSALMCNEPRRPAVVDVWDANQYFTPGGKSAARDQWLM